MKSFGGEGVMGGTSSTCAGGVGIGEPSHCHILNHVLNLNQCII